MTAVEPTPPPAEPPGCAERLGALGLTLLVVAALFLLAVFVISLL